MTCVIQGVCKGPACFDCRQDDLLGHWSRGEVSVFLCEGCWEKRRRTAEARLEARVQFLKGKGFKVREDIVKPKP